MPGAQLARTPVLMAWEGTGLKHQAAALYVVHHLLQLCDRLRACAACSTASFCSAHGQKGPLQCTSMFPGLLAVGGFISGAGVHGVVFHIQTVLAGTFAMLLCPGIVRAQGLSSVIACAPMRAHL